MSMKVIKDQNGIGLVEVIFSLGIAVVILTSLVSLSLFTLRTSVQNKLLIKGSSLATQELELVRSYRDTNSWEDFITGMESCDSSAICSIGSGLQPETKEKNSDIGTAENVVVSFTASDCEGDSDIDSNNTCVRISVQASWEVGSDTKNVHNYTEFSNW